MDFSMNGKVGFSHLSFSPTFFFGLPYTVAHLDEELLLLSLLGHV